MNEDEKKNPETPQNEVPQKALRTYESDVADVLAHKNISTTKIAIAEKVRQTGKESIGSSKIFRDESVDGSNSSLLKKISTALASLLIIILGIGGAYYLYTLSPLAGQPASQPTTPIVTSIVPSDSKINLNMVLSTITASNILGAIQSEFAKPQSASTIKEIILTQTLNNQKFRVNITDMLSKMGINPPDMLVRSLSNDWMLGVDADSQGNKNIFVDVTVNYFQNAFAGMLQWESTMTDDLKSYFPGNNTIIHGSFTDRIVKNKDVREFVTSDGQTLFLYSFIDNSHLIITSSESALSDVLVHLEQKAFMR